MILDTSALVAIVMREPDHARLRGAVVERPSPGIGAPTLLEAGLVLVSRLGLPGRELLGELVAETGAAVIPFGQAHWPVSLEAFQRFGKGRHPAALNFGDCLTYAVAKLAGEPLLCTGNDFPRTDLALVA